MAADLGRPREGSGIRPRRGAEAVRVPSDSSGRQRPTRMEVPGRDGERYRRDVFTLRGALFTVRGDAAAFLHDLVLTLERGGLPRGPAPVDLDVLALTRRLERHLAELGSRYAERARASYSASRCHEGGRDPRSRAKQARVLEWWRCSCISEADAAPVVISVAGGFLTRAPTRLRPATNSEGSDRTDGARVVRFQAVTRRSLWLSAV